MFRVLGRSAALATPTSSSSSVASVASASLLEDPSAVPLSRSAPASLSASPAASGCGSPTDEGIASLPTPPFGASARSEPQHALLELNGWRVLILQADPQALLGIGRAGAAPAWQPLAERLEADVVVNPRGGFAGAARLEGSRLLVDPGREGVREAGAPRGISTLILPPRGEGCQPYVQGFELAPRSPPRSPHGGAAFDAAQRCAAHRPRPFASAHADPVAAAAAAGFASQAPSLSQPPPLPLPAVTAALGRDASRLAGGSPSTSGRPASAREASVPEPLFAPEALFAQPVLDGCPFASHAVREFLARQLAEAPLGHPGAFQPLPPGVPGAEALAAIAQPAKRARHGL